MSRYSGTSPQEARAFLKSLDLLSAAEYQALAKSLVDGGSPPLPATATSTSTSSAPPVPPSDTGIPPALVQEVLKSGSARTVAEAVALIRQRRNKRRLKNLTLDRVDSVVAGANPGSQILLIKSLDGSTVLVPRRNIRDLP